VDGLCRSDDNAVVDGDFAITEDELQPALKAMRVGGINNRRNSSTHDVRATAHFVFSLLGQRFGQNWPKQSKARFWPPACPA